MARVGSLSMVLLPVTQANPDVEAIAAFSEFKRNWGRHYKSDAEEEHRFNIFSEKLTWINEENQKDNTSTMVVNDFTDLTIDEFKAMYTGLVLPQAGDGFRFLGYHEIQPNELFASDIDWVAKGAVTPVKNQGQCGSCWSFSTTGVIEGRWQIATGQLISLSESQFVDCDSQEDGCDGGYPPESIAWAKSHGICTESSYPYKAEDRACSSSGCTVGVPNGGVIGVRRTDQGSASSMVSALNGGPVSVAVDANGNFGSYGHGIMSKYCGTELNHAVLAVGYSQSYWKVKNSWGTSWGESGYIRLARSIDNQCGILNQASYPLVKGSPGPTPPTPPGPTPPGPTPPGPTPCTTCTWNSDCPSGQDCYYPSATASSGCCSAGPPAAADLVIV